MPSEVTKIFADRLQDLIASSGLSIKELSSNIGVSTGALSKYQNDVSEAGIDALAKIARYFDVSTDWLIGLSNVKCVDIVVRSICEYTGLREQTVEILHGIVSELGEYPVNFIAELFDEMLKEDIRQHIISNAWRHIVAKIQDEENIRNNIDTRALPHKYLNDAILEAVNGAKTAPPGVTYIPVHAAVNYYEDEIVRGARRAIENAVSAYHDTMVIHENQNRKGSDINADT